MATTFRYDFLCVLTLVTRKLLVVCGRSTYRMTALLSDMSTLCVRAGCKIRMVSYASKHALQSLSDKPFLRIQCTCTCTQTHNLKTSCHLWTFTKLNDSYIIEDILRVVQSCNRDPTGELRPETRIGCSLIRHFVCILQARIYIADWFATTPDNETHVPYDCILHTKQWLCCQRCIVL